MKNQLRQRLAHNEQYLAQSEDGRAVSSSLTYGTPMTPEWLQGEAEAIKAENEFLRAVLKAGGGARE